MKKNKNIISLVVSCVEAVTVSDTGPIGLLMNIISTCTFACTAAVIYKKKRTLSGAVIGLIAGCIFMTAAMLLWNYAITPFYMNIPRETVKGMLIPAFLPFNLIKGGLNTAFTLLLYKPVVTALRKAKLIEQAKNDSGAKKCSDCCCIGADYSKSYSGYSYTQKVKNSCLTKIGETAVLLFAYAVNLSIKSKN